MNRRERSLKDPEKFLREYFPEKYTLKFGRHHYEMIDAIVKRAKRGGRQAVAAPRGCGKSELVKGMLAFLFFAGLVRFPLLGAATKPLAHNLYADFMNKIEGNDLLYADFPEVCHPVRELEGAHNRAKRQHVNGRLTRIKWSSTKYLRIADVPGSDYGGFLLSYFGLDSAFRGFNIESARPDFVLIDDPETRESAKSYDQGVDREEIIDRDVAGLVSQEDNLAIVVLTTVQNNYCLSARLTNVKIRSSFNGMRFGMVESWPTHMDMWNHYIELRHKDQIAGDEHGLSAVQYYLDNQQKMDEGVKMLSDHFVRIVLDDNTLVVHSAIQQAFNKIADTNLEAYKTEYQNNPTEDEKDKTLQLTAGMVSNRISGLDQNVLPNEAGEDFKIVMGLDLGDQYGHWVKIAYFGNAIGVIIDYGIMEVPGWVSGMQGKALEIAIYRALMAFAPKALKVNPPDICLIDSGDGDHTDAVYQAVLDLDGLPWVASKGWDSKRFRMPRITEQNQDVIRHFKECWAGYQEDWDLWLWNVNTEYWKHWLQKRFLAPTFDPDSKARGIRVFNDGSLSLFNGGKAKRHLSFAHHIVSEEMQEKWEPKKGRKREWVELSRNNHFLDATALACCGAGAFGFELIKRQEKIEVAPEPAPHVTLTPPLTTPDGRPFLLTER